MSRLQSSQRQNRQGAAANELFDYDPAGNLLDPAQQHVQGNAAYDPNTPLAQRGQLNDNLVRVFEDKRYFYDGYSRLIEKRIARHTVQRFEWDDEHRLVAVHTTRLGYPAEQLPPTQVSQTTRFEYDALGRRVAKVDSFGRTDFIWEGMRLIEERRGAQVTSYVYEPGSYVPLARLDAQGQDTQAGGLQTQAAQPPTQEEAANSPGLHAVMDNPMGKPGALQANNGPSSTRIYHFHTDQSGLPEELSDHSGRIRWRVAYKAWGNTLTEQWTCLTISGHDYKANDQDPQAQASTLPQNLRFQGQYLDRDTGLHYNTFRFYDPDIGRFISPDPIGLRGGINLHGYLPNTNVWADPLGWDWNYYLTDANGNIYYHGRAADGQTMNDVMRRHGNNVGKDGLPRMGPGDTINRTTPVGTPKDTVRGIENSGTRTDGKLGRGGDSVRGNIDHGISDEKLKTPEGIKRMGDAEAHLKSQGANSARDLKPIESKTC